MFDKMCVCSFRLNSLTRHVHFIRCCGRKQVCYRFWANKNRLLPLFGIIFKLKLDYIIKIFMTAWKKIEILHMAEREQSFHNLMKQYWCQRVSVGIKCNDSEILCIESARYYLLTRRKFHYWILCSSYRIIHNWKISPRKTNETSLKFIV